MTLRAYLDAVEQKTKENWFQDRHDILDLVQGLRLAIRALERYADQSNYESDRDMPSAMDMDDGEAARQALADLDALGKKEE